jgi:hypothetical protein
MELLARIRPLSRRAALLTALVALLASAFAVVVAPSAQAAKKKKAPTISRIAPLDVAIGETLTLRGRNFIAGRKKNTVVFKRAGGGRAVFAKGSLSTRKMLRVKVPNSLAKHFRLKDGNPVPTRFRLRVLAKKFGKKFTSRKRSPLVSAPRLAAPADASGDCDADGTKNGVDADDDNDLLDDVTEKAIGTDPCKLDSEGDGIEDGFEYQSAKDLNDDEYQHNPNQVLPYPAKRPYPNPLFADATRDFDGDSLSLTDEQLLWRYTYNSNGTAARTLSPLSYSDGMQYSLFKYENGDHGRRTPAQPFSSYTRQQQFIDWAAANGRLAVRLSTTNGPFAGLVGSVNDLYDIRDADLSKGVDAWEASPADDGDGWVSDDERDEDADGLSNYEETHGRLQPGYWAGCYEIEAPFPHEYAGTHVADADSDGDGVLDGADDQDHDDVPNLMEISRLASSRAADATRLPLDDREGGVDCRVRQALLAPQDINDDGETDKQILNHANAYGRVNPFNPCLPFTDSRTCPRFIELGTGGYAPFDLSVKWVALQ